MGSVVLDEGKEVLSRRKKQSGVAGLLDVAGRVMDGVEDLVEGIQDLGLPRRVWEVIDRVGGAAEQAYLDQKREDQELQWKQEAAERAWTHCDSCGRTYGHEEDSRTDCPSCGAPRGDKPAWLK
jgi:rubrerythrin